jgi:glycosyltransferase involved in cell wall biosynthesis
MELSIIIPVYNSSKILNKLIFKIIHHIKKKLKISEFEIILINDFSDDNSWNVIKKITKKNKKIKGIDLAKNFGQHNAILAGLKYAKGKRIITMDDDFEHPPEYIKKFYFELDKSDACYTNYLNRKHSLIKSTISQINNFVSSFLLNKSFKIYLSSFRGLKKKIRNKIIKYKKSHIYLDYLILINTKKIKMINIQHGKRLEGKGNYTIKKLLKLWASMILSIDTFPITIHSIFNFLLKLILTPFYKMEKKQYIIKQKTF